MAVLVLKAFAVECGAARGGTHEKAASAAVAKGPDEIADALETEHGIEDEERDHGLTPCRVRGSGCGERTHGAGLGDAFFEDLALLTLRVAEEKLGVDRLVALPEGRVDLDLFEQRIHS